MIKGIFSTIIMLLASIYIVHAQKTELNKHQLQICFGGQYHAHFGDKHIGFHPRDTISPEYIRSYSIYGGFDKQDAVSFDFSCNYKWTIIPSLFITAGIGASDLREIFISPADTVLYYSSLYSYHKQIVSYKNNIYRFNVPFCLGYEYKFLSIQAGVEIDFYRYYSFKQVYLNDYILLNKYCGYEYYWNDYNKIYPILYVNFCYYKTSGTSLTCSIGSRMVEVDTYDFILKTNINFGLK